MPSIVARIGLAVVVLLLAACDLLPPGPGAQVDIQGRFIPDAAADPSCIFLKEYNLRNPRSYDLASLPGGLTWARETGIVSASGEVIVGPWGWARITGQVIEPDEDPPRCPGITLAPDTIESIPPLEPEP